MSETGIHEPQDIIQCSKSREECQGKMHKKMDEQHATEMNAIRGVSNDVAFIRGRLEGKSASLVTNSQGKNGNGKKKEWIIQLLIAWAPYIAFAVIIGGIALLKRFNWL